MNVKSTNRGVKVDKSFPGITKITKNMQVVVYDAVHMKYPSAKLS